MFLSCNFSFPNTYNKNHFHQTNRNLQNYFIKNDVYQKRSPTRQNTMNCCIDRKNIDFGKFSELLLLIQKNFFSILFESFNQSFQYSNFFYFGQQIIQVSLLFPFLLKFIRLNFLFFFN